MPKNPKVYLDFTIGSKPGMLITFLIYIQLEELLLNYSQILHLRQLRISEGFAQVNIIIYSAILMQVNMELVRHRKRNCTTQGAKFIESWKILSFKEEILLPLMVQVENQSTENILTMKTSREGTLMLDYYQWQIMVEILIHHSSL